MAIRLACLASDVGLHAPVEIDVGYSVLANVAAAELVVWSQCGSCRKLPGGRAWLLEWRKLRQLPSVLGTTTGEPRQLSLTQ